MFYYIKQIYYICSRMIRRFFINYWPTIVVLLAVLWLTLAPDPVPEPHFQLFKGADKVVHLIMMGGLAATLMYDYSRQGAFKPRKLATKPIIVMAIAVAIFSAIDEWAQGAMGLGRSTEIYDLIADIAGVILAAVAARKLKIEN
jgi:VanZ family protein